MIALILIATNQPFRPNRNGIISSSPWAPRHSRRQTRDHLQEGSISTNSAYSSLPWSLCRLVKFRLHKEISITTPTIADCSLHGNLLLSLRYLHNLSPYLVVRRSHITLLTRFSILCLYKGCSPIMRRYAQQKALNCHIPSDSIRLALISTLKGF